MHYRKMFYGAKPEIFRKARLLRKNGNQAEKQLWQKLNKKQVFSLRFKRQHPIGPFIADFYCHKELDGPYHDRHTQKLYDDDRDEVMHCYGLTIIRFKEEQAMNQPDKVIEEIKTKLQFLGFGVPKS